MILPWIPKANSLLKLKKNETRGRSRVSLWWQTTGVSFPQVQNLYLTSDRLIKKTLFLVTCKPCETNRFGQDTSGSDCSQLLGNMAKREMPWSPHKRHIHQRAGNTINSKFFTMNSAFASFIIQIFRSLCCQRVGVYVDKPITSCH